MNNLNSIGKLIHLEDGKYKNKEQLPRPYGYPFVLEGELRKLADNGVRKYDYDLGEFLEYR